MTPQPTLALTETGNLQIHIPMRIRRMRIGQIVRGPLLQSNGFPS